MNERAADIREGRGDDDRPRSTHQRETEADAVQRANATEYGLAASVWTRDVDRPLSVGREIKAGTAWTNTWAVVHEMFEEGGFKQSGLGRLNGMRGLEEFQETKHFIHPLARG